MAEELLRSKHGFGNLVDVESAISLGKLDEYDILFLDGAFEPKVGWIDKDGIPRIVDTQKVIVVKEDTLPSTGIEGKIYIFKEDGYFWNGEKFINLCKPTDVTELSQVISALETLVAKKADAEQVKADIEKAIKDTKDYVDEKSEAVLEKSNALFEKVKYEISDTPVGTLVDYREEEIRIMCPADAKFEKQAVGTNGDPNCYYLTLKTYAPNDSVVGYIEHLGDQVDAEVLTDLKTDKYGRKYQPTWLSLAKYDESTGWTYYGASSTKEKYIGWDYQIDWYDANGVMIASDSIRINLSNENCHNEIKPYYMGDMTADIVNESKKYTDEQIESVLSAFTVVEF